MSTNSPTQKPRLNQADINLLEKHFATKRDIKNFGTKDDLKNFATKDDLRNFATKDDLKNFATKDDLKNFATKDDLIGLAHITEVEEIFEKYQAQTDKKLDKIITILDSVVGELQTTRQEQTATAHQLQDHEDRLTALESASILTS
jgi:hypothetical protein